jgi:hypothetical protein
MDSLRRRDGIAYLLQHGDFRVQCSRYGNSTSECAEVAWRHAYLVARETGTEITEDRLEHSMSLVVNNSDDVAYLIRTYGNYKYR